MTFTKQFTEAGTFEALYACQKWLRDKTTVLPEPAAGYASSSRYWIDPARLEDLG